MVPGPGNPWHLGPRATPTVISRTMEEILERERERLPQLLGSWLAESRAPTVGRLCWLSMRPCQEMFCLLVFTTAKHQT